MSLPKWGRTSPFGLLNFAHEYRLAGDTVHGSGAMTEFSMPQYMLMGQSIELSLKAFLRSRGMSETALKRAPFSHDLENIFAEAMRRHLNWVVEMLDFHRDVIQQLQPAYVDYRFRYIKTGTMTLPHWDSLSLTAMCLTKELHDHCLRASFGAGVAKTMIASRRCYFALPKKLSSAPEANSF